MAAPLRPSTLFDVVPQLTDSRLSKTRKCVDVPWILLCFDVQINLYISEYVEGKCRRLAHCLYLSNIKGIMTYACHSRVHRHRVSE